MLTRTVLLLGQGLLELVRGGLVAGPHVLRYAQGIEPGQLGVEDLVRHRRWL